MLTCLPTTPRRSSVCFSRVSKTARRSVTHFFKDSRNSHWRHLDSRQVAMRTIPRLTGFPWSTGVSMGPAQGGMIRHSAMLGRSKCTSLWQNCCETIARRMFRCWSSAGPATKKTTPFFTDFFQSMTSIRESGRAGRCLLPEDFFSLPLGLVFFFFFFGSGAGGLPFLLGKPHCHSDATGEAQ